MHFKSVLLEVRWEGTYSLLYTFVALNHFELKQEKRSLDKSFRGNPLKLKVLEHLVQNKSGKLAAQDSIKSYGQALLKLAAVA